MTRNLWLACLIFCVLVSTCAHAQVITTVAGGMRPPDGVSATNSSLTYPTGVALDGAGNIYVADYGYQRIRKINSSGVITTVAGNGRGGFGGDGGPATAAYLYNPIGVATDASGNVYIADRDNNRIRKINTSGIISTVAGTGAARFSGDGGPATAAELNFPTGVAADGIGNIYIAEDSSCRIRKIDVTGTITTFAGTGTPGFFGDGSSATAAELLYPIGVATDGAGNVYIADADNNRVRKVDLLGIITTIAGNGSYGLGTGIATANGIYHPTGVSADPSGNIFIVQAYNGNVTMINTLGVMGIVAGHGTFGFGGDGGPATAAELFYPYGIATDGGGNIYVADYYNSRVRKIKSGIINTIGGGWSGDGLAATSALLNYPAGVTVNGSGEILVADYHHHRIRKINASGIISTIAGDGIAGNTGDGGAATAARLYYPYDVATDHAGNIYIADLSDNRIRKISTSGIISAFAGSGAFGSGGDGGPATAAQLYHPSGVAIDNSGNVYIADLYNHKIRMVNTSGIISTVSGTGTYGFSGDGGAATAAELYYPYHVNADASGNIYIADCYNQRIRKVNAAGIISTFAGNGSYGYSGDGSPATAAGLYFPTSVATDASGNVIIADFDDNRIRKVNPLGVISTIAGTGAYGYSGDGGAATAAQFWLPGAVATDSAGNVYVSDYYNNAIRKVTLGPPITGPATVCVGSTTTMSNAVSGGTWTTSNTAIATAGSANGIITGIGAGVVAVAYAAGLNIATATVTVTALPGAGVLTGSSTISSGSTTTLSNTTAGGIWSSSNTAIATIGSGSGIVSGVSTGNATISYTVTNSCGSATATSTINVTPSISIATGSANVCTGYTITLSDSTAGGTWSSSNTAIATAGMGTGIVRGISVGTAVVTYIVSTTVHVTTVTVISGLPGITGASAVCPGYSITLSNAITGGVWRSSNPARGSIDAGTGILTGRTAGTTTISYKLGSGCITTYAVTVNVYAAITGASVICEGLTFVLSNPITGGTWSSSNPGVATSGSTGIVTGVSAGTTTISYILPGGCIAYKTATVNQSPAAIAGPPSVCVGSIVTLSNGVTGGSWTSGNPTRGSIDIITGIVAGRSAGTAVIDYTLSNGCRATLTETINAFAAISGGSIMCEGLTTTLANAATGGIWSSANSAIATAGSAGIISGISAGTAIISYSLPGGCLAVRTATVNQSPTTIAGLPSVCVGLTTTLSNGVTGGTWVSASPIRGSIDALSGVVTGRMAGTTMISYTLSNGCRTARTETVSAFAAITGTGVVCEGSTTVLANAVTGGTWSSGATAVATVSTAGIVNGIMAGTAVITYGVTGGCTALKTATVNQSPTAITGSPTVAVGATITLSNGIAGGTWTSSNPGRGSVNASTGEVSGRATGTTIITYTLAGNCRTTTTISVTAHRAAPGLEADISGVDNAFVIFPNPNTGELTIKGTLEATDDKEVEIAIMDIAGKTVYRSSVTAKDGNIEEQLRLTNIANGTYLLRLNKSSGIQVFRFVVEK
jgi:uncharacterized protein YjdB